MDIKDHFFDMYNYKKVMKNCPYNINSDFFTSNIKFCINKKLLSLKKYNIPEKLNKDIFSYLSEIFSWINNNLIHDGSTRYRGKLDASSLLKYVKKKKKGINCLMHAIVLQEIFHSQNLKAHLIQGNPQNYKIGDCHWLINLYVEEFSKWMLVDPVWLGYCINTKGVPLDFFEIRYYINTNQKFIVNKQNKCTFYEYLLCRYLFFFGFFELNGIGTFEMKNQIKIYLSPKNFNSKFYIENKEKERFRPFNIKEYLYFSRFEEKSRHIFLK